MTSIVSTEIPTTTRQRHVKVLKLRILKPADGRTWKELDELLREVRYRVFRLANLAVSNRYLAFHLWRTKIAQEVAPAKPSEWNKLLRSMLLEEEAQTKTGPKKKRSTTIDHDRFSKTGALPDTVAGALIQYKIKGLTTKSKWADVICGKASLPTFRLNGPVFIRCDKPDHRRLRRTDSGEVELELMICRAPYPRVLLATKEKGVGEGQLAVLNRLLDNADQNPDGYRQRCFEVKHDEQSNKWWLYVTYDFPASSARANPNIVVGVDVGVSCPLYAAINNGHARLGWRAFSALGARIRTLQRQTAARRRSIQRGGAVATTEKTARTGHGRKRKLLPIGILDGRIEKAYTTLNHQLSAAVVKFAQDHGAGVIQVEDLAGLTNVLRGTYIGANWRYHQLQHYIEYKAAEAGIEFRKLNPRYTSMRCSKCGHIDKDFDRARRDIGASPAGKLRFKCPKDDCGFEADPDYNAARNLSTLDIEKVIKQQCRLQGIPLDGEPANGQQSSLTT